MTFEEALAAWLPGQRWFAGKGTPITGLAITADTTLVTGDPGLRHLVLAVDQGSGTDSYQVFAGTRAELPGWLDHARIGPAGQGQTAYDELNSSNPSVLAFVREYTGLPDHDGVDLSDHILCVNNLSRFPQPVELDLRRFKGITPVECMGGVTFPPIGDLPYLLTLPGHGFYWFQLPGPRPEHPH